MLFFVIDRSFNEICTLPSIQAILQILNSFKQFLELIIISIVLLWHNNLGSVEESLTLLFGQFLHEITLWPVSGMQRLSLLADWLVKLDIEIPKHFLDISIVIANLPF